MQEGGHVVIQGVHALHQPLICLVVHLPAQSQRRREGQKQKQEKHIQPQPQMFTEPLPGRRWQLQAEPNVPGDCPVPSPALYPPRKPIKREVTYPAVFTLKTFLPKHWGAQILSMSCPFSLLGHAIITSLPFTPTSPPKFIEQSKQWWSQRQCICIVGTVFKGL